MDATTRQENSCSKQLLLCELDLHAPDKLGNKIEQFIWRGPEYAVYRSSEGVYVHFSDETKIEKEQRKAFIEICPELCELRYLTAQMSPSWWRSAILRVIPKLHFVWPCPERGRALYEHNMAQALMLLMEGNINGAKAISRQALAMAVRRITNDNRIRYVRACIVAGAVWTMIGLLLFHWTPFATLDLFRWQSYVVASIAGAGGAVFSIATRLQTFELKPCNDSRMNVWMSVVRVGMGIVAAVALLLFLTTFLHDTMNKVLVGQGRVPLEAAAMLGFLGGFAERLVPNLLRQTVARIESSDGTPVQAVRGRKSEAPTERGGSQFSNSTASDTVEPTSVPHAETRA